MVMTVSLAYGLNKPGVPGRRAVLMLVLFTMLYSANIIPNDLMVLELGFVNKPARAARQRADRRRYRPAGALEYHAVRVKGGPGGDRALPRVAHWNEFFNPLLSLVDQEKWPIQAVLRHYVHQGSSLTNAIEFYPGSPPTLSVQLAVVVIATVPILLIPFLRKYCTEGVLTGAIRG